MAGTAGEKIDLARLRRQEEAEFTVFVREYQSLVMGLGQTMGLKGADLDDLAAETFAMAYRALPNFRGESELSTWLYRIAYRTAIKVRRKYPRRGGEEEAAEVERADGGGERPGDGAEAAEMNEAVWKAVGRLDAEQAMAVEMFYRRGMSVEEVAGVMEKPVGTVKTLLFRARERLRMLLKPMERLS